jgi:hypothetical protein
MENSRPVTVGRMIFSYLDYVSDSQAEWFNSIAVFPLVFQTPKLEGMGERKRQEPNMLKIQLTYENNNKKHRTLTSRHSCFEVHK